MEQGVSLYGEIEEHMRLAMEYERWRSRGCRRWLPHRLQRALWAWKVNRAAA